MTSPGADTSVVTCRATFLTRQSARRITTWRLPKEYLSSCAALDPHRRSENSEWRPGVVTDSAQQKKSITEAFNPGTELRYIRPSRHCGGRTWSDLHEYGARYCEQPHADAAGADYLAPLRGSCPHGVRRASGRLQRECPHRRGEQPVSGSRDRRLPDF